MKITKEKINPNWYFIVLVAALFFEFLRPQELYLSFLAPLRLPAITLIAMAYIFIANKKTYIKEEKGYQLMIAFWLLVSISVSYAVNTRQTYEYSMSFLWMGIGFIFPLMVIIDNTHKLFRLYWIWLITNTLLAMIVLQQGGTGPGGIVKDENDVALALVMAVPFAFYMSYFPKLGKITRLMIMISGLLMFAAIGISSSRGGMVGLVAVFGTILILSKKPFKNLIVTVAIVLVLGGSIIASLPEDYVTDMENVTNPEDDTRDERLYSWSIGWVMFLENPLLGIGAGNYAWTNHLYYRKSPMWEHGRKFLGGRTAHSVYFTLIPELGLVGIILFLSMIKLMYNRYRAAKRGLLKAKFDDEVYKMRLILNALIVSLVGFLISGAFISVLYYPFFWYLMAFILLTYRVANKSFKDSDGVLIDFSGKRSNQV